MCWRLLFVLCVLCYCLQRITLSISEHDWFVPIAYFVVGGVLCFVRYVHLREWIKLYFYQLLTVCNACACAGEYVCFCLWLRRNQTLRRRHAQTSWRLSPFFVWFLCMCYDVYMNVEMCFMEYRYRSRTIVFCSTICCESVHICACVCCVLSLCAACMENRIVCLIRIIANID